jgi:hypothetical protein
VEPGTYAGRVEWRRGRVSVLRRVAARHRQRHRRLAAHSVGVLRHRLLQGDACPRHTPRLPGFFCRPGTALCRFSRDNNGNRNLARDLTEHNLTYSQSSGQCTHNELTLFRCIRSRLCSFRAFVVNRCRFVDDVPPFFEHGWWTQRCFDADPIAAPLVRINTFCLKCKCGFDADALSRSIERCTTARTN